MKKLAWALAALAVCALGAYLSFPRIVRWQVERRFPDVAFSEVAVTWGEGTLTFTGVGFDRGWVKGKLDRVTSDWERTRLTVVGGDIEVDLDARREGTGEAQKRTLEASGLTVRVKRGKHQATLTEARLEGSRVCFKTAVVVSPPLTVEDGCVERDGTSATAEKVSAAELPVQGVEVGPVVATGVEVNIQGKSAKVKSVTTTVTLEGQTLPVEATGVEAQHGETDSLKLATLRTKHPWLAPDWTTIEDVAVTRGKEVTVQVGPSTIHVEPDTLTVWGDEPCQTWASALPKALQTPPLDTMKLTGSTSFRVTLRPKPSLTIKSACKATCSTMPNLRRAFRYMAYTSKGERFERTSGRGTKGWMPIGLMGHMPVAVPALEDPGFASHRGFITQAFANSLTDNLKQGRFLRGGSTLTMQLVKNLWLTREKTLGRKAQEFLLAQALESCYQKDEILELYLNVVEFGPDQYGAAAGAEHWFKKGPGELTPTESFWMASILPRPSRTGPPTEAALARVEKLMKKLAENGRIPEFVSEADDADAAGWEASP